MFFTDADTGNQNISHEAAKEMIGHSDISMTDRYSHLSMNHNLSRQTQLAEHYANGSDV